MMMMVMKMKRDVKLEAEREISVTYDFVLPSVSC